MIAADLSSDLLRLASPHWLRPHWLWCLLALPGLAWWWRRRQHLRSVWRAHVDPHLLPRLLDDANGRRAGGGWLALMGGALAICALAGPAWQKTPQALWQTRTPLVIALDLSSASLAPDLPPSRLLQARGKIARLLATRAGGQVGLVAFSDDAYTVAPLTEDAANVALFLDALSPDVMPVDGSRADRAIERSARLLQQAGFERGDILLLTDHADGAARTAASAAHRDGYRISVLGLGTPSGAAYRDAGGRIGQARLDPESLRALAAAGGGAYAALTPGDGDLATLGVLDPQRADADAGVHTGVALWHDQGYWLLLPVLVLALFAFRRGGVLAVLLLLAWLPWQPAQAAPVDWWQRPDQRAHAQFERGAQAYHQRDYAAAAARWKALPGADAAYNLGNALAEQGDYDAAIAAYDRALHLRPHMADALTNRARVVQAMQRQQQSQPGQKQGQSSSGQPQPSRSSTKGQQGSKPGAPNDAQNGSRAQSPPQPQPPRDGTAQSQSRSPGSRSKASPPVPQSRAPSDTPGQAAPESPADAKAQQQADAAQRQRMQRALRGTPAEQPGKEQAGKEQAGKDKPPGTTQTGEAGETPQQRERRIANEAWLRRVPDDPGGLLRAKFRLEYERRQREGDGR
jgi:Ca-activated chloride channel family protein